MDINLIKKISVISAILGGVLGVITLIPFIDRFAILFLILFEASAVLIYMKKFNLIGFLTSKEAAIYGAYSGFLSFLAFCVIFIPVASILGIFIKSPAHVYVTIKSILTMSPFITVILAIFVAMLSALINSFFAMTTIFIWESVKPTKFGNEIDVDITVE